MLASPTIRTDSAAGVLTWLSVSADRPSLEIHSSSRPFDPVVVALSLGRRQTRVEHGDVADGAVGAVDRGDLVGGLGDLAGGAAAQRQTCRGEDQRCGKEHPAREAGGAGHGGSPLLGNSFSALRSLGTALSRQLLRQLGESMGRTAPATAASGAILQ